MLVSDEAAEADPRIGRVLVNGGALAELLAAKADQIGRKFGSVLRRNSVPGCALRSTRLPCTTSILARRTSRPTGSHRM